MLKKCGAVFPVGKQHAYRVRVFGQGVEHTHIGVADVVGQYVVSLGKLREQLRRHRHGFQLIRYAGWDAQVVFQDYIAAISQMH